MYYGMTTEELAHHYSETDVLRIYKEIGFDAVDYSYDMHAYEGSIYDQEDYVMKLVYVFTRCMPRCTIDALM